MPLPGTSETTGALETAALVDSLMSMVRRYQARRLESISRRLGLALALVRGLALEVAGRGCRGGDHAGIVLGEDGAHLFERYVRVRAAVADVLHVALAGGVEGVEQAVARAV